jgi:hypothetical protein
MNRFARTLRAPGKAELMMALMGIVTVVGVMIALAVGFAGTRTVGPGGGSCAGGDLGSYRHNRARRRSSARSAEGLLLGASQFESTSQTSPARKTRMT